MKQSILLTGAAGFIGAHTAKQLIANGYDVVGIDDFNDYYEPQLKEDRVAALLGKDIIPIHRVDIRDRSALASIFEQHKFDGIVHLAACAGVRASIDDPILFEETNVLGTINLLELARKHDIKPFVCASSSSVYGENKKIPFSEADYVDHPISPYAATKKACELISYTYHHLYEFSVVNLRFFTVYGPWGRPDMAYFKFANLIRAGKPIDVYNNGDMKRDFTYVDDIVDGIEASLELATKAVDKKTPLYEVVNLGNNESEQLVDMISYLEKGLGVTAEKNYLPMQPGDVPITYADIAKAKKLLGYSPKVGLKEGIDRFATWYREYYQM
jgi:UDP-glucuronate 4-epimerase